VSVTVSLKTTSLDRYKANLGTISLIVGKAAADVEGNAKDSILKNSGNYKEYDKGHWSSPPGTPPNSDTGNLANSIGHRMAGRTSADIYANAKYAVPLELGWTSKGGNTVPARPFMEPALMSVKPAFLKAMKSVLKGK
jgi:phage gpG-like protein